MNQFFKVGFLKTIRFNLTKLPFKQAIRMPVLIARNVTIIKCQRGCFYFTDSVSTFCVTIGFNRNCNNGAPSSINIAGKVIIRGNRCHAFGAGCHIGVAKNGILDIGDGFGCTGNTTVSVAHSLIIGKDNLWSYNCAVMDNDGHKIYDEYNNLINNPKGIIFGDNVWMGNGCQILKGAKIASGCVIGAGSLINKEISEENCIITTGGRVLKNKIHWKG